VVVSLKTFGLNEVTTAVEFQKMVEQIQRTALLYWSPWEWGVEVAPMVTAYPTDAQVQLPLRPLFGDYIHLTFSSKITVSGGTILVAIRRSGVQDIVTSVAIGTGWTAVEITIDCTALSGLGDATGEDIELLLYCKATGGGSRHDMKELRVCSSNSADIADTLWW